MQNANANLKTDLETRHKKALFEPFLMFLGQKFDAVKGPQTFE